MKNLDLEPAERDPVAIRRTVIFLIITMVVGGCVIWWKYQQLQEHNREKEERGYAARISRLTSNFAGIAQDGKTRTLFDLEGKVWIVAPIVPEHPAENTIVLEKMKQLADRYKGNKNVHLVCMSVSDPTKHGYKELAILADSLGADIEQWWFLAAGEEKTLGYLKDHLKMDAVRERKGEDAERLGRWDIQSQLRVVDQSRRTRGKHEHFDFDFANARVAEAKREIAANPELAKEKLAESYLKLPELWQERMLKVIDYTLNESAEETDNDPQYGRAVIVVLAIGVFIIVMGMRLRKRSKG